MIHSASCIFWIENRFHVCDMSTTDLLVQVMEKQHLNEDALVTALAPKVNARLEKHGLPHSSRHGMIQVSPLAVRKDIIIQPLDLKMSASLIVCPGESERVEERSCELPIRAVKRSWFHASNPMSSDLSTACQGTLEFCFSL